MQSIQKILKAVTPTTCSALPVIPKNEKQTMSSPLNNTDKADKRIDMLFSNFAAFYGHVWRSQFKDDVFLKFAKKIWQEALMDFSDSIINKATIQCRDFFELPPTLPQLLHCCRQIKKQTTFYVVKNAGVPADPIIVKSFLEQCRKILTK